MKIYNFKVNSKQYCLMKMDNHNFTVREYLNKPVINIVNDKEVTNEFKPAYCYFGTLEYATRKAFLLLGIPFIELKEINSICTTHKARNGILELKPSDVTEDNISDVRECIEKLIRLGGRF